MVQTPKVLKVHEAMNSGREKGRKPELKPSAYQVLDQEKLGLMQGCHGMDTDWQNVATRSNPRVVLEDKGALRA